ncbi:1-acyl-sn-glycerol-3-phosphate acyltransferase [Thiorhodococcus mannitoliphagus]|uniref:1-acyl-sn-glycerol-3-phosphate acyltransferase n=1 Tax=Thiorhodococcus mannitoliphagus TaxID=329406 RepID=A0A6P1DL59_9GAMM|nr:lysophospholipid acyltransferase family protein [Thiorhodococcus mannitoliphagus]NEX18768.1 1-acyl-sn-glycerol-3-phosphate acyltransferase [Thiorhodococcus mannitoliphagus]
MIFFRSLLYQIVLVLSSLLFSIAMLCVSILPATKLLDRLAKYWGHTNLWALKILCGLSYRVTGLEHLPKEPVVVLAKHQSAWETIAFWVLLPEHQSWVLKQELTRIPFFGWALTRCRPIAIDRSAGRREITKLIQEGTERLNAGRNVIIFPEGTRVAPGTHHAYGVGGALLAERSGRPILPIAHNAGVFWGRRSLMKRPGIIDVVIGPLIEPAGRKATKINALAEEWIEKTVAKLPTE